MGGPDDELNEAQEVAWCRARRADVATYLQRQGVTHGKIGKWPAWHLAPYLSVWAIESVRVPGRVGWWALCGDLPLDYCSFGPDCDEPRWAVRQIAQSWTDALASTRPGAETIGDTGLPAHLTDLLRSRADMLLDWVADDDLWQ